MSIPIVVGVTGHRKIRECDLPDLEKTVRDELQNLISLYKDSTFIMLNSLAAGADILCAEVGVSLGMRLLCPIPFETEEYKKDFSGEQLIRFENLIAKADEVFVAAPTEPEQTDETDAGRDFAYRQAGIYIATHSHVLLALWDGKDGTIAGCGAAETVGFMLKGNYKEKTPTFKSANDGAVIHVLAHREGDISPEPVKAVLIENEAGSLHNILSMTDGFNREANGLAEDNTKTQSLIPEEYFENNKKLAHIHDIYKKADALSMRLQKKYLSEIKWFSIFAVLLVLAFLLYDEMDADIFLPAYGLIMLLYLTAYLISRKKGAHAKYLEYRVLAESMRAQFFLCAAGIDENIGKAFTWTQKHESTWAKQAVGAVITGSHEPGNIPDEIIKKYWIDDQLAYHQRALKRDSGKLKINERTALGMLIASVAIFAAVLALEFFAKDLMNVTLIKDFPGFLLLHEGQAFTVRALIKILLGVISAVTVFLSDYYDKLSFGRKSEDHEKMIHLYRSAGEKYYESDREALLFALATEELIENGNWMSYCRENAPTFNL